MVGMEWFTQTVCSRICCLTLKKVQWSTMLFNLKSALGKTTVYEDEELARAVAASLEQSKQVAGESNGTDGMAEHEEDDCSINIQLDYPPLPEEPTGISRHLLCRVAIRLPDGQRIQRNFLHTDPIKLLWSILLS